MLDQAEDIIRSTVDLARGSVVTIGRDGRGTGFVVAPDRVLTSAHNVRDKTVAVSFPDGRTEQGRVHGVDLDGDIAVVHVSTGDATALTFAEMVPSVGSAVVALSRGGHRERATLGFVSGEDLAFNGPRGRVVRGGIEHTAPLARGSSGGPVFDRSGAVVGINTHRVGQGFYLARAADAELRTRVDALVDGWSPQRRTLGVAIVPADVASKLRAATGLPQRDGVLVHDVEDSGPAARAGIMVGDLIVQIGGTAVATLDDLRDALGRADGETIEVGVVRATDELTFTVVFATPNDADGD